MQRNKSLVLFFACLLFVLNGSLTWAQKSFFRYYTVENGLPQSTVYTLFQDRTGYIWIGTQGGVARFDGHRFMVIDQTKGLSGNHVNCIYQGKDGNMWFGHRYEGISRWDGLKVMAFHLQQDSLTSAVNDIYESSGHNLWLASENNGLFKLQLNSTDDSILKIAHYTTKNGLSADKIYSFFPYQNNALWILTPQGIDVIDPIHPNKIEKITNSYKQSTSVITPLEHIVRDTNNSMWASASNGLNKISYNENKREIIRSQVASIDLSGNNTIVNLCSAQDNSIWLASTEGIIHYKNGKSLVYTTKNGLSNNNVFSILADREGNVWVGENGSGLCQYLGDYFEQFDKTSGLANNIVQAVTIDKQRSLWVGTTNGITRIFFTDSSLSRESRFVNYTKKDGLCDNSINCFYQDKYGKMWIGTQNGVAVFSPKKNKFNTLTTKSGLAGNSVISINSDKQGNIWLCTLGMGCTRVTQNNAGKITSYKIFNAASGFFSNSIWIAYKDKQNNLWFGSDDAGMLKYDGKTFTRFGYDNGLSTIRPASITEDPRGHIWIASIGKGIFDYDGKTFKNYTTREGIGANNPYLIISDNKNNIWVGTNTGLDRFDPFSKKVTHFGKSEGFSGVETNENAAFKDDNGILWIGTVGGVMRCVPDELNQAPVPPRIHLEKIKVFHQEEALPKNNTFPYNKNYLTFYFTGITFRHPEKIKYQYMLKGFDKSWSPLSHERSATYSNIPPGKYTFLVKAQDTYNGQDISATAYSFKIATPFWKSNWFYLSVIGVIILLFIVMLRFTRSKSGFGKGQEEGFERAWHKELNLVSQKNHIMAAWFVIGIYPTWIIFDYLFAPSLWVLFGGIRIIYSLFVLLAIYLSQKNKIHPVFLGHVVITGVSIGVAYMCSRVSDPQTLFIYMIGYSTVFLGGGMLLLWDKTQSVICIVLSIISFLFFYTVYSPLSYPDMLANGGMLILTLQLIFILIIWFKYNMVKKEFQARYSLTLSNKELEEQKKKVEEKNKNITDSIQYAKTIQNALLPDIAEIKKVLPESFVFYMPRDIVSGDFYWIGVKKNDVFIAAVDCTGHGVPGAFVSMIGSNFLNQIVLENDITVPAMILSELNKAVKAAFLREGSTHQASDGMDIALCKINLATKKLEFAGAQNPLYYVHNGELNIIKANKVSIGDMTDINYQFESHELLVQKGDACYIFSDGFADQFGGAHGKKFKYKQLQKLLLKISQKSMEEQKETLQQTLKDWKGELEQVDDILIIGFKI